MKRFRKLHLIIVLGFCVAATPPAQATYQDSYILQYLIQRFNYIMEYVNRAGFALEHLTKQLGSTSVTNAHKQSAEVESGVMAEHTKTLGKIHYAMDFAAEITNISSNGRKFLVSSVSSVGCAAIENSERNKTIVEEKLLLEKLMKNHQEIMKTFPGPIENQRIEGYKAAVDYANNAKTPILAPGLDISEDESEKAAKALAVIVNKKVFAEDHGLHGREGGGMLSVDYYQSLTETITNVVTNNYAKGVSIKGEASLNANKKAQAGMIMSENYVTANNLKTEKGVGVDKVEAIYSMVLVKSAQLEELRQQEKLHTVRALAVLRKFNKEAR